MQHITDLFGNKRFAEKWKTNGKRATSERSIIIGDLAEKTGYTVGRILVKTTGLKENDLYYLLSIMKDAVETKRKSSYRHAFDSALFVPRKLSTTQYKSKN